MKNFLQSIFILVAFTAALFYLSYLGVKFDKFGSSPVPTDFTVTPDTKIDPNSELAKYVTQEEVDDFAFRYWDIDEYEENNATLNALRNLLRLKDTDKILNFMTRNGLSADVNMKAGTTPLMYASFYDDEVTAKRLIDMGANAHEKDNYKLSPLAYAIENNSTKTAKLLLDSGVKFSNKEKIQRYLKAPQNDRIKSLTIDGDNIFVEYEVKYGQKNEGSKGWILPFDYITFGNFTEMLQILFSMGYFDENGNYFKDMEYMPNYEPMLNLLLDNNVSGQPTKEELKGAYKKCHDTYLWYKIRWIDGENINKKRPFYVDMPIKNLEKYCTEPDGTFQDVRTFMSWANEQKKMDAIIRIVDTDKVIYIDANISSQNK